MRISLYLRLLLEISETRIVSEELPRDAIIIDKVACAVAFESFSQFF